MFTFPSVSDLIKCHYHILLLFSHPVTSDSLQPHGLQHTRTPCPLPPPGVCLPKFTFISSVLPVQPSHPLMPSPPSALNLSQHQRLFQWVICSHQMTKILELQLQHSPSSEYSGLISLQFDWFNLFAVQGTFKSLLQHHSSKASILWCSAFFTVQVSQPYVTTGKTIALTIWTFVSRVMSLLFNTLSRFVIAFLPITFWFMAAVTVCSDFGAQEEEIGHYFHLSPSVCHAGRGLYAMILVFFNI